MPELTMAHALGRNDTEREIMSLVRRSLDEAFALLRDDPPQLAGQVRGDILRGTWVGGAIKYFGLNEALSDVAGAEELFDAFRSVGMPIDVTPATQQNASRFDVRPEPSSSSGREFF